MNFSQLLGIIRAAWVSIVAMTLVAALVAYGFASSLPKEYTAKARVMLNVGNSDPTQFSQLSRNTYTNYIGTQLSLVGYDGVLRDVVTRLGWPSDPAVVTAWEQATGGKGDLTTWASRRLAGNVAARQFEDSAIVEIYYTAESIDVAKTIVAMIRTAYIADDLRLRVAAARRASAWNRTAAAQAFAKLREVENERAAFVRTNAIPIDRSEGSLEMQVLGKSRLASIPTMPTTLTPITTASMTRLKNQLDSLDAQIAVIGEQRGPSDPVTLSLIASRDQIRTQLAQETDFARAGENATDAQITTNRALRDREYVEARLRVLDRAPLYDKLARMNRELALRTKLYTNAEQRVREFDSIAAAPSGLIVIGDVIADDDMVFPNIPLAVGLASGLGLALGIGMALLGEMMRRMVRGAEDLHFYSGVPVMAVIASSAPRKKLFGRFGQLRRAT